MTRNELAELILDDLEYYRGQRSLTEYACPGGRDEQIELIERRLRLAEMTGANKVLDKVLTYARELKP